MGYNTDQTIEGLNKVAILTSANYFVLDSGNMLVASRLSNARRYIMPELYNVIAGVGAAGKAIVLDNSRNITNVHNISANSVIIKGERFKESNVYDNVTGVISNAIGAGYILEHIILRKCAVGNSINIAGGITALGTQLFPATEISESLTVISIDNIFSASVAKSIYLHGAWHGGVSVTAYGVLKKGIY